MKVFWRAVLLVEPRIVRTAPQKAVRTADSTVASRVSKKADTRVVLTAGNSAAWSVEMTAEHRADCLGASWVASAALNWAAGMVSKRDACWADLKADSKAARKKFQTADSTAVWRAVLMVSRTADSMAACLVD
jgi:hypothetical protein